MLSYRLRERIVLQAPVQEQDALGEPVHRWLDAAELWAEILPVSGREFVAAQSLQHPASFKIVLRYQTWLVAVIRPAMRIRHGATVYHIEAVLPRVGNEIHLWCASGVQHA